MKYPPMQMYVSPDDAALVAALEAACKAEQRSTSWYLKDAITKQLILTGYLVLEGSTPVPVFTPDMKVG